MARKDQEAVQLPRPALPVGFRQFATQVAGHTFEATNAAAVGLLQDSVEGCVLKPLGKPECEVRELNFYESLASAAAAAASAAGSMTEAKAAPGDNDLAALGRHVPRFYGHLKLVVNQREHTFVRLEDLTRGMQQPCVMDVKMGRRTWDPLSSPHKRQVEEQKYVICKQKLGLCLPGFLVYLPAEEPGKTVLMRHGKDYGKSLNVAGFRQTMGIFFNASTSDSKTRAAGTEILLREVLRQLQEILAWFKRQRLLHFYASSLLICYDYARLSSAAQTQPAPLLNGHHHHAQPCADDASEWVRVRMIDFAHVYPAEDGQPDENYMFGLQSLIEVVESILYR